MADWPLSKRLFYERELLGIFLTGHPLKTYEKKIKAVGAAQISELANISSRKPIKVAGVVIHSKEITTKKNREKMAFVTLEDQTGSVEVLIFPSVFKESEFEIFPDAPILVEGTLDKSKEVVKIKASSITPLEKVETPAKPFHVFLPSKVLNKRNLFNLRAFFEKEEKGDCPVIIHVQDEELGEEAVITLPKSFCVREGESAEIENTLNELFGNKARVVV